MIVQQFRLWEAKNRVNRQKHVLMLRNGIEVSPPVGIAAVHGDHNDAKRAAAATMSLSVEDNLFHDCTLSNPVKWTDLDAVLRNKKSFSMSIIMR